MDLIQEMRDYGQPGRKAILGEPRRGRARVIRGGLLNHSVIPFYWYWNVSYMGYPILRGAPQGDALVVLSDSIRRVVLPLRNVLYHKNVPMIIQNLGNMGCLSLFYSPIAHFITLAHSE